MVNLTKMKALFLVSVVLLLSIDSARAQKEQNSSTGSPNDKNVNGGRPLVVIDGSVYDSFVDDALAINKNRIWLRDTSGSMFSIPGNPDDIEALTILKDDKAVSLYGDKAKNGVLMITTKQGKDKTGKIQKE